MAHIIVKPTFPKHRKPARNPEKIEKAINHALAFAFLEYQIYDGDIFDTVCHQYTKYARMILTRADFEEQIFHGTTREFGDSTATIQVPFECVRQCMEDHNPYKDFEQHILRLISSDYGKSDL